MLIFKINISLKYKSKKMGEGVFYMKRNKKDSQIFKHNNKERLCFCCNTLQDHKDDIQVFKINNREYGSIFDGDEMEIQLCPECAKKVKQEWFDETPEYDEDNIEVYKLEDKIREFIDTNITVVENLEYIYNCPNRLMIPPKIDRDDWIKTEMTLKNIKSRLQWF